ncbi:unnamed protein product [Microthlaspi erraticum]|uniref:Uncharacterized protein n=1 Tax=Microthlaspi erraticum TaxID=1685480 RepID=A0A6D2JID6_9BRAS|nr:unnamed protein product [Microthlaspi erraticum]
MKIDDDVPLDDSLPDEHIYAVEVIDYGEPLLADDGVDRMLTEIANYLAAEHEPTGFVGNKKKKFLRDIGAISGMSHTCTSTAPMESTGDV